MEVDEIKFLYNQIKGNIKQEVSPELDEQLKELGVIGLIFDRFSWNTGNIHVTVMFSEETIKQAKENVGKLQEVLNKLNFKLVICEQDK